MRVHEVEVHPALPERLGWLGEIARNVWTSWNPEAQELFARLDPEGWEAVEQNPVALLRRLPQEQLDAAASGVRRPGTCWCSPARRTRAS